MVKFLTGRLKESSRLFWTIGCLMAAVFASCTSSAQRVEKTKRVPLEKSKVEIRSPARYEKQITRCDPKTGAPVSSYDPKPRVEVVDEKTGRYLFKWIGYDGREKVIAYQRADAIDVVVSASVESNDRHYLYTY